MRLRINPKTIFISTGMTGVDDFVVRDKIACAARILSQEYGNELEFVHNFNAEGDTNDGRLWYLGEAIKKMDKCDTIFMCKGWENHKGCVIEHEVAIKYGKTIIYEEQ